MTFYDTPHALRPTAAAPVLLALGLLLTAGCRPHAQATREESTWPVMGTFASLVYPAGATEGFAEGLAISRRCFEEVNTALTVYTNTSALSKINAMGAITNMPVSPLVARGIGAALDMAAATDGRFDPTVTPLVNLWGFNGHHVPDAVPSQAELDTVRASVGYTQAVLATNAASFHWKRDGMSLDLGGIAKGMAVDICYERLQAAGATTAVINLGGNVRFLGQRPDGEAWRAGVRDPFEKLRLLGQIEVPADMAVATSGNYERFVTIGGKRYAHIIDPTTGTPVTGMAGVTVVAPDATTADGLSTALFVAGTNGAAKVLGRFPGCEALLVPDTKPHMIIATAGMLKWLSIWAVPPAQVHTLGSTEPQ